MKTQIIDGAFLDKEQLAETGRILYLTDPEIYPTAFGSEQNAGKVFPCLTEEENGLFSPRNIFAAVADGKVCGAIVACNGAQWKKGTLERAFVKAGLPVPEGASDAEENYFVYEAEHETGDYVLCLCVAPQYRKQGIATALLKKYLADKTRVSLECLSDNASALSLYLSVGFRVEKEYFGYSAPGTPPVKVLRLVYAKQ